MLLNPEKSDFQLENIEAEWPHTVNVHGSHAIDENSLKFKCSVGLPVTSRGERSVARGDPSQQGDELLQALVG